MSWRGLTKRLKSPTSAATVTATIRATPSSSARPERTGASDQLGSKAAICSTSCLTRCSADWTSMDIVPKDDLLGRVLEAQRRQPSAIGQGPCPSAGIDATVAEQKPLQMLARLAEYPDRGGSGADQIAHRL